MSENSKKILNVLSVFFSIILVVFGLYLAWNTVMENLGDYSPDSFSYYDIAQTIGKDFGRVSTIRQYVLRSDYNCSFPYFYPLCIWLTDCLTGSGLYAGVLFNMFLMLLTVLLFMMISRQLIKNSLGGAIAAFLLILDQYYLEEVYAARSIPLSILLTTCAAAVAVRLYQVQYRCKSMVILLGVLTGLNMMNRFDEISLAAFLGLVLFLTAPEKKRFRIVLLYLAGLLPVILPWVIYSLVHFGTFFISDNRNTMTLVKPEVPSYVFLPDKEYGYLQTVPEEWFGSRMNIASETVSAFFDVFLGSYPILMMLFLCGVFGCIKKYLKHITAADLKSSLPPRTAFYALGVIVFYVIAKCLFYILVGYVEKRYYVELVSMLEFSLILVLFYLFREMLPSFTTPALIVAVFLTLLPSYLIPSALIPQGIRKFPDIREKTPWVAELENALNEQADPDDSVLMADTSLNGFMFGAVSGRHTYVSPENVSEESLVYVLKQYADAEWIVLPRKKKSAVRDILAELYAETEYTDFYLYHIVGKEQKT